ncbi:hypothetical protein BX600DRAFT_383808 [Xylariales sp. PMI_506]|nr:hypothetical protein BX600DRAFT_383808 [Xylariales sp. PMI_506]
MPSASGEPERRWYCDKSHLLAFFSCLICFALSILAIRPMIGSSLSLSWELGLTNQLVAIGLLLSLMNECTGILAPTFFLILETRRNIPKLQNYEAIIKKSAVLDKADNRWRAAILFLTLLPLSLSVAYKKLTEGSSTMEIQSQLPRYYGLLPLPLGTFNAMNNSIFYMINASVPYITASLSAGSTPRFPAVYGFNTVLLDNTSTALLDLPAPDFLPSIQRNLTVGESWSISAAVNGTIARYNETISSYRDDDTFWTSALSNSYNPTGLATISLYNGYQIGLINGLQNLHSESPGPYCLIGFFKGNAYGLNIYNNMTDPASLAFRQSAYMFDIYRERCEGKWTVTRSSIQLVNGNCTGERTKQEVFNSTTPYYADALPILSQWLSRYTPTNSQSQSLWTIPSLTTSVVSMFWSRVIYLNPTNNEYPEIYYPPINETIWSTKPALQADWGLYLTLSIHPMLCAIMLLSICICYETPIGKGFGLISVLAGIRKEDLDQLLGAGLSGTLAEEVPMKIMVDKTGSYPKIQYALMDIPMTTQLKLKDTYF